MIERTVSSLLCAAVECTPSRTKTVNANLHIARKLSLEVTTMFPNPVR